MAPRIETSISEVESWGCEVKLPAELDFGFYRISSRHYCAVRLRSADGLVADFLALTRGAPLDVVISDVLAPRVVGRDGADVASLMRELSELLIAFDSDGLIGRARSLIEICLHDLAAQRAGAPLWIELGGAPRPTPVQVVEGYALAGESDTSFADRLAARAHEGYPMMKLEAASYAAEPHTLARRLRLLRERVGAELKITIDAGWSLLDVKAAKAAIARWQDHDVEFVEDPLPRSRGTEMAQLRRLVNVPISGCDEVSRGDDLQRLLELNAVDALRLDASVIGGLDVASGLARAASSAGTPVSLHEHPEVHRHCALAWPGIDRVELFPLDRPFDVAHQLQLSPAAGEVIDGYLPPPSAPGLGLRLDIDAVSRNAVRHARITAAEMP